MRVGPECSTSSSSVPTRSAVPPVAASASPEHPVEQLAPLAPWREPKLQPKSACKRSESGDNGSGSSKEASLAIRRDRETFSLRHCAVSHKAREIHVIALWATLLRRLFPAFVACTGRLFSGQGQSSAGIMKERCGHIVVLLASARKTLNGGEDPA